MSHTSRINVLECPMDRLTMDQTIQECMQWCDGSREPHTLITVNASILVMMRSDSELRRSCLAGDVIVADGVPVVWASRIIGTPLPARVAGVDLMQQLLEAASARKQSVYFLGARQEVLEKLVELCEEQYPGLVVAGFQNGYFNESDHDRIMTEIRESNADMLFVGMPTPFKEIWCEKHRNELNVPVIMGVGGSFDVIAGYVSRAPKWMQQVGMEWFWRLCMEPRKMWKRYLVTNSVFIWLTFQSAIHHRIHRNASDEQLQSQRSREAASG